MLAEMGDFTFKLGNVHETKYHNLIEHSTIKLMCLASCLDSLPHCTHCVFKPYCGVCPLSNYFHFGNIFSQTVRNPQCKINSGILKYLFEKLQNPKIKKIFENWVNEK